MANGHWREATDSEIADYLAGHVGGDNYRETEHGLEIRDSEPREATRADLRA